MNDNTPLSGEAGRIAAEAKDKLKETAAGFASTAKEQAQQQYSQRVGGALSEVSQLASALRETGQKLSGENGSRVGSMVINNVAGRLETLGSSLDGKDLSTIISDVERFGRRNPAVFLGTAAILGFIGVRFLKSTGTANRSYGSGDFDYIGQYESEFGSRGTMGATRNYGTAGTYGGGVGTGNAGFGSMGNPSAFGGTSGGGTTSGIGGTGLGNAGGRAGTSAGYGSGLDENTATRGTKSADTASGRSGTGTTPSRTGSTGSGSTGSGSEGV